MLTRRQHWLLITPFLVVFIPFLIVPAVLGFVASFSNYAPFEADLRFTGLENYTRILQDSSFLDSLRNVTVFTAVSVLLDLILGISLAYLLRDTFRGRGLLRLLLLVPWLVSPVASGIMWHYVASLGRGLPNYFVVLFGLPALPFPFTVELALPTAIATEIWRKVPLVVFLALPGMLTIPQDYWDYARLEGASLLTQIRVILIPSLRLLLLTITLLLIGDALGTFESILMLTSGGPGTATLTLGFYSYRRAFGANDWVGAATSGWFIVAAVGLVGVCYIALSRRWQRQSA